MTKLVYIFKLIQHIAVYLPVRVIRIFRHVVRGIQDALSWFIEPFKVLFRIQQVYLRFSAFQWSIRGIRSTFVWIYTLLLLLVELIGLGEILMILWAIIFRMRPLTKEEIDASKSIHPDNLLPYDLIRVDHHSMLSRISHSAICSMYVIHLEKDQISLPTMIHELTHVAQYITVGAIYMPQAIIAQNKFGRYGGHGSKSAYDYEREDSLVIQHQKGLKFSNLNREAQAELVQDYFILQWKKRPIPNAYEPFIAQMRERQF